MRGERVKAWPASAPRMNHRGRGPRRRALFAMALRRAGHGGGEFGGSLAEELDLSFRKFSGQDQISICAALADRAHRLGHALNGVSGLNSAVRLHPSSGFEEKTSGGELLFRATPQGRNERKHKAETIPLSTMKAERFPLNQTCSARKRKSPAKLPGSLLGLIRSLMTRFRIAHSWSKPCDRR